MFNKPTLVKAQKHLENLEAVFEKWLLKKLGDKEFAAQAVIELIQARRILAAVISKSME